MNDPATDNSTSRWRGWWQASRLIRVRLRFVVVLLAMALIVGQWEFLATHFNRWFDAWTIAAGQQSVSPDTEYFCPMCPGVLSGWPDTCPVCNMPLVRRRKGESVLLPSGVVARMQLSPQRIQLAGLQTSPVQYRNLNYEVQAVGRLAAANVDAPAGSTDTVRPIFVEVEVASADRILVQAADRVTVAADPPTGEAPWKARCESIGTAGATSGRAAYRVTLEDGAATATAGQLVRVRWQAPAARLAPFATQPHDPPALKSDEPRTVYLCVDHADEVHLRPGKCAHDSRKLESIALADNQRVRWTCAKHSEVLAADSNAKCPHCAERDALTARIVTFAPAGQVLSIPVSAVVDTGHETLVYWESAPGMYDGVRVELGRRAGAYYPVVSGLSRDQKVVTRGAFLVDAESRLNPSIASTYFGAAGPSSGSAAASTPSASAALPTKVVTAAKRQEARTLLAKFDMPSADRKLAEQQAVCPVTGLPLGSMGKPPKRTVGGKAVFVCCEGCEIKDPP